jgi:ADP-ribose pyrophosphatase YjhB (NUDIX family)
LGIRLITNPAKPGLLLTYSGQAMGGHLQANDDVSEARWFDAGEIPWDELAFETTLDSLREWMAKTGER